MALSLMRQDAVDVLTRQHAQIRRGFYRAALPGPGRRRAFERLMRLLAVHEAAEEAHVHPVARRVLASGPALAARRRQEEKEAKELLVGLWHTGPYGKGYLRRLNEVRRAVLAHAAREEREEFAALRRAVGSRRLRLLGAEVRMTQAYAPTRPHRWVNDEATNKLAAPLLGPFDRARDLARQAARRR
ncbi:hemerythrin domain-containing protein [Streptomyces mexicanus]|uniref:Hemerythrin domain-containing protein n=1 Tax=Streptomyces mexicanus TaxID=178566 RepID=A0A7X1LTY9_9ACTN|nr:hemerythrin domain-containing protein [Streptomyces mexicanus]MBC2869678.1 hemerythrin domain-containing protein [Streptomyces mexicanus]